MPKPAKIVLTYCLDEHEKIQAVVRLPNAYPDALDQGKATALAMLHAELADVLAQNHVGSAEVE